MKYIINTQLLPKIGQTARHNISKGKPFTEKIKKELEKFGLFAVPYSKYDDKTKYVERHKFESKNVKINNYYFWKKKGVVPIKYFIS